MRGWMALLIVVPLLAGCTDSAGGDDAVPGIPGWASPEDLMNAHLAAIHRGNVEAYTSHIADTWWDFGGCRSLTRDEIVAGFRDYVESGEHAEEMGAYRHHRDLVLWDQRMEMPATEDDFASDCEGAGLTDGDVAFFVEPSAGSPLFDGLYGVLRQGPNGWEIIGAD